ncbi:Intracisternal A-particle Gag-related polyprotein [Frankliniella fusca]|uniref:Intracisternal A-particle Gag-related polyprotein n=1 Tax=Frankliniella fusca TaxID=407009 RepID=A0AAE1HBE0_9NEOP|nr:Intracisternal A-particle Gag-related polyprotein [Frankliniella fusca]
MGFHQAQQQMGPPNQHLWSNMGLHQGHMGPQQPQWPQGPHGMGPVQQNQQWPHVQQIQQWPQVQQNQGGYRTQRGFQSGGHKQCFNCGSIYHLKFQCPEKNGGRPGQGQ